MYICISECQRLSTPSDPEHTLVVVMRRDRTIPVKTVSQIFHLDIVWLGLRMPSEDSSVCLTCIMNDHVLVYRPLHMHQDEQKTDQGETERRHWYKPS